MQKQAGFTLTELMIVIAIVAILVGIAIPNYIGKLPAKRLQRAIGEIQGTLHMARMRAVKENTRVEVKFEPADETVTATVVAGPTFRTVEMPADVDLISVKRSSTSSDESSVTFDSRGLVTCSDGMNCSVKILVDAGAAVDAFCIGLALSGNSKLFRNNCP